MLKRLATVIWWIGAICAGGGIIGVFFGRASEAWVSLMFGALGACIFFSAAYVVGGSFWRPPSLDEGR